MRFVHPEFLGLLWGILILFFVFRALHQHRQKMLARVIAPELWDKGMTSLDQRRRRRKDYLLLGALIGSILALSRPQWGYEMRDIKRQGLDILLVMDTSRSMLTADVKPNRLERAKLAVKDLLQKLAGDRVGLIAFAGDAFLACPLTVDYSGFTLSLDDLSTESIPRGGTNLARALEEAIKEYDNTPSKYKVVVILTDGENLEDEPEPIIERARKKGIRVFTVGLGTQEGELIQIKDMLGKDTYLKDGEGNFVKSRLNSKCLEEIAVKTGGAYIQSSGAVLGLDLLYDRYLSQLQRRDIATQKEKNYHERFQIPLGAAFCFLLMASYLSERKKDAEPF